MKFDKFVELANEDYALIKEHAKRVQTLCGINLEDITYLPYQVLKHDVPAMIDSGRFEEAIHLILKEKKKNITFGKIRRQSNYLKFRFLLWIQDQYKSISEMEMRWLFTPPDPKMISSGIRDLEVLGDVNLIDSLALGDILKWNEIRNLPYNMIFDKNLKLTIERRISKKMNKIK